MCNSRLDSSRKTLRKRANNEITTFRTMGSRSLPRVAPILAITSRDAPPALVVPLPPLLLRFCGRSLLGPNAAKTVNETQRNGAYGIP